MLRIWPANYAEGSNQGDEETDGPRSINGRNDPFEVSLDANKGGMVPTLERRMELSKTSISPSNEELKMEMGYSAELVDGGSLRRGLLCVCCKKIPRDAMQTSDGHRVCSSCAERIKRLPGGKCTDCGLNVIKDVPCADFAARREIKSLKVFCGNKEQGCEWQGELQKLQFHSETACEYKPEPCEQCEALVAAKFMGDHLKKNCPRRQVQCEYCSISLEFRDIEEHQTVCPTFPVSCSACQEEVIRIELEDHEKNDCKYKVCTACGEQVLRVEFKNHIEQDSIGHFVLLADKVAVLKMECEELKASKKRARTSDERAASPLGGGPTFTQLSTTVQGLIETIQSLTVRFENAETDQKDLQRLYEQEREKNIQLEVKIAQLEANQQLPATNMNHGPLSVTNPQFGANFGVTTYNFDRSVTAKHTIASPPSSVSSGYSSIDDMSTRLTNLEHKVEKVNARDADFNKRTSNLEETVRVLQNTLTDIHPTDKGSQAVVRAGEIVPQDKQQTYLMEKRMGELEQQVTSLSTQCTDLELQLQASLVSTYNGDFLWRIPDVSRRIRDAKTGKVTSVYSPPFFSSHTGYKMCIRAYLNGDGMGEKTHLSLFFVIMKGEFDALLSWPFQSRITLTLINQDNRSGDVREVFRANPQSKSFQRPTSEMNVASGCPKFVPLEYLNNPCYVKQDVLYIRCSVDTSFLTHP